ncbi:MAG: hypothetical protein LBJ64_08585 [Deltaproteobacteria bacterium]|jgi:hypothetical protein|nr:hypothetical protein [Deltaproteobacteria bacterium]
MYYNKKGHTYILESTAKYDKQTKRNNSQKRYIGKVDKITGEAVFKHDFIRSCQAEYIVIKGKKVFIKKDNKDILPTKSPISDNERKSKAQSMALESIDSIFHAGSKYFIEHINRQIGLDALLKDVFSFNYETIFSIISFMLSTSQNFEELCYWIRDNGLLNKRIVSQQRINDFIYNISSNIMETFNSKWNNSFQEDCLFVVGSGADIFSEAKNKADLPSTWPYSPRLGLTIFGQKNKLPLFQTFIPADFTGLNDFKQIADFSSNYYSAKRLNLFLDSSFYSSQNIQKLAKADNLKYLICLLPDDEMSRKLVQLAGSSIHSASNFLSIESSQSGLQALHLTPSSLALGLDGDGGESLEAYIFFDPHEALAERQNFVASLAKRREEAKAGAFSAVNRQEFDRFFILDEHNDLIIKETEVNKFLALKGFSIILGNAKMTPKDVYDLYIKSKYFQDIYFMFLSHVNLSRFSIFKDKHRENFYFISFLAFIIYSRIYQIYVNDSFLRSKFSLTDIFSELHLIKSLKVSSKEYVHSLSDAQKQILTHFSISIPENIIVQ